MRFTTKEDIRAPADFVFGQLSDFDAFEQAARQRGAEVLRLDRLERPTVGQLWEARIVLRNRQRRLLIEMTDYSPPELLQFSATSDGIAARFSVDLIALAPDLTRLALDLDIKPRTVAARLAIQSARLAKGTLKRRFKRRARNYAFELEDRFAAAARDARGQ
ncbi:SRPBCC family protein [Rhodovulum sp. YNF3179]|uniref:SRPBCC family protein n=1 Tax=Rhodovulum sp. YNF3179 TaxID=3425127 RepID=UPI003D3428F7